MNPSRHIPHDYHREASLLLAALLLAAHSFAWQSMQACAAWEALTRSSRGELYLRQGHSKLKLCKHSYALGSCCSSSPSPTASVSGLQTARAEGAAAAGGCKLAACKTVQLSNDWKLGNSEGTPSDFLPLQAALPCSCFSLWLSPFWGCAYSSGLM